MAETVASAAVVSAIFFILQLSAIFNLKVFKFKLYWVLAMSCMFRGIGFALRAVYLQGGGAAANYRAASLAFNAAGFGISIAALILMMGTWWHNTPVSARPGRSTPLSVATRVVLLPSIIILGPIMGIVIAALLYGVATPSAMHTVMYLRKASTWGIFTVEVLLLGVMLAAAVGVWRWKPTPDDADTTGNPKALVRADAGGAVCAGARAQRHHRADALHPPPSRRSWCRCSASSCSSLPASSASWHCMNQSTPPPPNATTRSRRARAASGECVQPLLHLRNHSTASCPPHAQGLPEMIDAVVLVWPGLMAHASLAGRYAAWRAGELPGSPWAHAAAAAVKGADVV